MWAGSYLSDGPSKFLNCLRIEWSLELQNISPITQVLHFEFQIIKANFDPKVRIFAFALLPGAAPGRPYQLHKYATETSWNIALTSMRYVIPISTLCEHSHYNTVPDAWRYGLPEGVLYWSRHHAGSPLHIAPPCLVLLLDIVVGG